MYMYDILYRYLIIFNLSKQKGTVYGKIAEKEEGGKKRGEGKRNWEYSTHVCACESYCALYRSWIIVISNLSKQKGKV